jgi:teichuronic acid biosynthesis glycosyltransferase TuaG
VNDAGELAMLLKPLETHSSQVSGTRDLVSVVVPCFNAGKFIATTVESVLSQTYRNVEIIVVDDKSTDASASIVQGLMKVDSRVRLIEMERNAGAPAAPRNTGVRAAKGRWIAFLDADDIWHPRKLEFQMRALAETGARVCSTQMKDFRSGDIVEFADPTSCELRRIDLKMQLVKYRTPTSSIVVEREWMLAHPFNEDLQFKAREDTDCFIRVHEYVEHSVKLEFPFVFYRLQDTQISGNKLKMVKRHLNMLKKYRLRSGESLGLKAYYFTFTHFALSVYFRLFRRML